MTLLLPAPPAFGYFVTNEDSPTGGAFGTQVTSGNGANVEGTWTAIHSTISYDLFMHTITFTEGATSGSSISIYVDLGIGPDSSNVTVIAENLWAANAAPHTQGGRVYHGWPLYVPAGTQLWARTSSTVALTTVRVHVASWGGLDHPESYPKIGFIEAPTPTGITAGTSGTLGSAQPIASFANDVCAVALSISADDASLTSVYYTGALCTDATTTVQELGICATHTNLGTVEQVRSNSSPIWCDIPAGQEVGGRLSCSGTADQNLFVGIHGFVRA